MARVLALLWFGLPGTGRASESRPSPRSAPAARCADTTAPSPAKACRGQPRREAHYGRAALGVARANGLNVCAAALYNMAANATWEGVLEWREKVSINDLIDTSVGGIALGEFFFQLGRYLNSAPAGGGSAQRWAARTLGFPVWVNSAGGAQRRLERATRPARVQRGVPAPLHAGSRRRPERAEYPGAVLKSTLQRNDSQLANQQARRLERRWEMGAGLAF